MLIAHRRVGLWNKDIDAVDAVATAAFDLADYGAVISTKPVSVDWRIDWGADMMLSPWLITFCFGYDQSLFIRNAQAFQYSFCHSVNWHGISGEAQKTAPS